MQGGRRQGAQGMGNRGGAGGSGKPGGILTVSGARISKSR